MAKRVMDMFSESDLSDQELTPSISRIHRSEIDVARLFEELCCKNRFNNNRNGKSMRSVAVQTDPETGNLPPSWLLVGERLIDDLYTGLGNIINTLYHDTPRLQKEASIRPTAMKYFRFVDGYWNSTLLPEIKIPDLLVADVQNKALHSEETKRRLHRLHRIASKLRNVIPYLSDVTSSENQRIVEEKIQSFLDNTLGEIERKSPDADSSDMILHNDTNFSEELERNRSSPDAKTSDKVVDSDTENMPLESEASRSSPDLDTSDMVLDYDICGRDSGRFPAISSGIWVSEKPGRKSVTAEHAHGTARKNRVVPDDSCGSGEIPGVKVWRYEIDAVSEAKGTMKSNKMPKLRVKNLNIEDIRSELRAAKPIPEISKSRALAGCSCMKPVPQYCRSTEAVAKPSGAKRSLPDTEHCSKNDASRQKNFIMKNIMDIKSKSKRVVSLQSRNNPS